MLHRMPIRLSDCVVHGVDSGAELFLVEGESAAKSVVNSRDAQTQAVLPMQGKPLNARKAKKQTVAKNEWLGALISSLGAGWDDEFDLSKLRYERVILLFDPDADGIHCGALMLMFFHRWMRPLLAAGRLSVIRPPVYEITSPDLPDRLHAYSDSHYQQLRTALDAKGLTYHGQRYRGLGSINTAVLATTCVQRSTRKIEPLGCEDAEAAIRIFSS